MAKFGEFCKMASSFSDVADFVTVYIEEAHPTDGWAFSNNREINTHRTIQDRIQAAKMLLEDHSTSFPVVCDTMKEEANMAYGGLYERLFIIKDGKIAYEGGRGPRLYFLNEVEEWLANYRKGVDKSNNNTEKSRM